MPTRWPRPTAVNPYGDGPPNPRLPNGTETLPQDSLCDLTSVACSKGVILDSIHVEVTHFLELSRSPKHAVNVFVRDINQRDP